jgi:hypothetical protein
MAKIQEYQESVQAAGNPPGKRVYPDAFESFPHNSGAGLMDLSRAVYQQQEMEDVSNVHSLLSKARADWTNHLQDSYDHAETSVSMSTGTVDSNGESTTGAPVPVVKVTNFADQYMGDLSKYVADLKQNVKTKQGAALFDRISSELMGSLQEKSFAAQSHLAGLEAVTAYKGSLNNYRNTLLSDPTQFKEILSVAEKGLGSWVEIPAADRIKLAEQTSEQLALSAVEGTIKKAPDVALEQLKNGDWDNYLKADSKYMLLHQAQLGINAVEAEAARAERYQEKMQAKARLDTNNGFMQKWVGDGLTMDEVLNSNLHPFGEGSKDTWLKMIQKDNAEGLRPVKTDPAWFKDTFQRIHLPVGDPRKITSEDALNQGFINGNVNKTDLDWLRKEVASDRTPDGQLLNDQKSRFLKMADSQISKSTLMAKDPLGDEQAYKFYSFVEQLIADTRKQGGNEHDLFNPKSKIYAGQYISQFQRSLQEQVQSVQDTIQRKPDQSPSLQQNDKRQQGETIDQWRKRTGR